MVQKIRLQFIKSDKQSAIQNINVLISKLTLYCQLLKKHLKNSVIPKELVFAKLISLINLIVYRFMEIIEDKKTRPSKLQKLI